MGEIGFGLRLFAEKADDADDRVGQAIEARREALEGFALQYVERGRLHLDAAFASHMSSASRCKRRGVAAGDGDAPSGFRETPRRRAADVGRAAKNEEEFAVCHALSFRSDAEAVGETRSDMALGPDAPPDRAKFFEIGIAGGEGRARLPRILGEIDPPARGDDDFIDLIEKIEHAAIDRKIERQREAGARKRQKSPARAVRAS